MTMPLADPFESEPRRAVKLRDPFEAANPYERPQRVEDTVPRHPTNGTPKVWLPDNSKQQFYGRPSGWGKKAEDSTNLERWKVRKTVAAFLDFGEQSRALRAERGTLGPVDEDKGKHNQLNEKALRQTNVADQIGTAVHAMTERNDLGERFTCPEEYRGDLEAWRRATQHFEVVTMPSGRPGVEVFVALDYEPIDGLGQPIINEDTNAPFRPVRLAGTFDRLVRYKPCPICGCRNYILDLKTGGLVYGQQSHAVQLGIYGGAMEYIHYDDGGERFALPDVCRHRGIIVNLPAGTGEAQVKWVNIAWGYRKAVDFIMRLLSYQRMQGLMVDFTPTPDLWGVIDHATSEAEIRALLVTYPGEHWQADDFALAKYAAAKIEFLGGTVRPKWNRPAVES